MFLLLNGFEAGDVPCMFQDVGNTRIRQGGVMQEATVERKKRTWQWLAVAGFIAMLVFSFISYVRAPADAALRAGHSLPDLIVEREDGIESTLEAESAGFHSVLVVTPSCDFCTEHLADMALAARDHPETAGQELKEILLLVIRSELIPRSGFQPALDLARGLGAIHVNISAREAQKMGIIKLPVSIALDLEGNISSVNYLER